jgi:hypothetical protein
MRHMRPCLPEWPKAIAYIPLLSSFLAGCTLISTRPNLLAPDEVFHRTEKERAFTSADQLNAFELPDDGAYRLGKGDIVVGDRLSSLACGVSSSSLALTPSSGSISSLMRWRVRPTSTN